MLRCNRPTRLYRTPVTSVPISPGGRWAPVADPDTLVPAWFACRQLGITKQTLNWWRAAGRLVPARRDSAGRPLYRYREVAEAEKATRNHHNSRRPPVGAQA